MWAIGCFRIRVGYRRRGVARALLEHVVQAAREAGAPGVEAYPIDPGGKRVDVGFAFVGIASMFDQAGFRRVLETSAHSAGLPRSSSASTSTSRGPTELLGRAERHALRRSRVVDPDGRRRMGCMFA